MKIEILSSILAATLLTSSALAQNSTSVSAAPIVTPSTPAPNLTNSSSLPAAAIPNQVVYTPRLPTVTELTNGAAAQGVAIDRVEQSSAQIVVVYRYANGRTNTVSYQPLPPNGTTTVVTNPPSTVVYESAPRVIYYDLCDPFWYPPVSIRLGFGFGYRGGFGGYHGGFHHRR